MVGSETLKTYGQVRWWLESGEQVLSAFTAAVNSADDYDSPRRERLLRHMNMYTGRRQMGYGSGRYFRDDMTVKSKAIQYNVVRSCVDSVCAKMSKTRPEPMFLTTGGNFELQQKGKRLAQYCVGVHNENDLYEVGVQVFRDAAIGGTGVVKIFAEEDDASVHIERVLPNEILVDPREAIYGSPRTIYQIKYVDREVLKTMFPKHRRDVDMSGAHFNPDAATIDELATNQIQVIEAWHLPSGPKAKDGRHVIAIQSKMLSEESWEEDYFPLAFLHWSKPLQGFWGSGLTDEVEGIQLEINELLSKIQRNMHLGSMPMVMLERGAKINKERLNNTPFAITEYTGTPPTIATFPTTHPEVFHHLNTLVERAYQIAGVSQLSAGSQKPAGLNSGRAMIVHSNIESERFQVVGRAYENFYIDIDSKIIDISKEMFSRGLKPAVRVKGKRFLDKLDWDQVDMDKDAYEMRVMPVSSLLNDPVGRTEIVDYWFRAGFIDKATAMKLSDLPDTEAHLQMEFAQEEILRDSIDRILTEGEYVSPEPFDNHARGLQLATSAYNRARLDGAPEDRLNLLRQYIQAVATYVQPPAPPPGVVGPGQIPAGGPEQGQAAPVL